VREHMGVAVDDHAPSGGHGTPNRHFPDGRP
jgi:hypothetical protein